MLDNGTKKRIDSARDILVGKVPDPKSQVEQITIAIIYKFMDDMDNQTEELGGKATFFAGEFKNSKLPSGPEALPPGQSPSGAEPGPAALRSKIRPPFFVFPKLQNKLTQNRYLCFKYYNYNPGDPVQNVNSSLYLKPRQEAISEEGIEGIVDPANLRKKPYDPENKSRKHAKYIPF